MAGTSSGVEITQNGSDIDIVFYQGKTINFEVIWGGDSPIDITGFDAKMHLREAASNTSTIAEFNTTNSRITIGGADGKITVSMSATDSAALPIKSGVYDLELTDGSGNIHLVMSGNFMITAEVTK